MFSFRFFHLLLSPFVTYRREVHFVQNRKHSRERFLTESKPIVFSIGNPLYSHEPEKKNKKLWNSPKLSFLLKSTLQKYFAAGTRAYKQFARLIPKINIQYQSFSYVNHSSTQAPNIKILFKRDSSSSVRSGLSTVWDRGTANTS